MRSSWAFGITCRPERLGRLASRSPGFTRWLGVEVRLRPNILPSAAPEVHVLLATPLVRAFGGRKGTRLLCRLLTSALRSGHLTAASVAEATQSRSPGVSSVAFRARSPDLRFASLMDMDFAISGPLVRCSRLVSGSCPSTRTFALRFLQTPPRDGSPCVLANPSPPSGWVGDLHPRATEHAQHTTERLRRSRSKPRRGN